MEQFLFDYNKVPDRYKAGNKLDDSITLYRGDIVDLLNFQSKALQLSDDDAINRAKQICENANEEAIHDLIDQHTSSSHNSPLISLTRSPQMAQSFATKHDTTIYQIRIRVDRLIFDVDNIGAAGEHGEFFALGCIFPSEILAVKIWNDDEYSELLFTDQNGTSWIRRRPPKQYNGEHIKDITNWRICSL